MRRVGLADGGAAVLLGVLGLAPAFAALPEAPLVALAVARPALGVGLAGARVWWRARRLAAGVLAGSVVGPSAARARASPTCCSTSSSTTRCAEKIMNYRASGLPSMRAYLLANDLGNIAMGLALGLAGGALVGGGGALVARALRPAPQTPVGPDPARTVS